MSWKRILKAARRLGTPVIIADEMADDPFVVMTMSKYEALIDENELFTDLELGEDEFEDDIEDINFAQQKEKMAEAPVMEPLPEEPESPKIKQEIPLEDRFYFEPLEDEFKK